MQEGTPLPSTPVAKRSLDFSKLLGRVMDACVMGLAMLMPLWFLPITLDVLELNKQTLLVVLTMVALIAWVSKSLLDKSFSLVRSWLHLIVVIFLGGYLVTSLFSLDQYISFIGNIGQMQWAFTTVAALVVFYLIVVNRFRSAGRVYDVLSWFLLGSTLAGLYGLLQIIGIHIFGGGNALADRGFNTIGTVNALGTFMVIPTVTALAIVMLPCSEKSCRLGQQGRAATFWKGIVYAALVLGLVIAVIVDFWAIWAALIFGTLVPFFVRYLQAKKLPQRFPLVLSIGIVIVSILLLIFKTPIDLSVPSEVSPSAGHSWQIAKQVLRDAPLFGSGPGTWVYDYAKYRSVAVNLSQFWTIRFERGLTAFLTMLGMLGLVGTSLWLMLVGSGVAKSVIHLIRTRGSGEWTVFLTVVTGWLTTVFLAFLYNYNLAHHFAFWLFLALIGVLVTRDAYRWDERSKKWIVGTLSTVLVLLAVGAISATWLMGQRLVADAKYSAAVEAFKSGDAIDSSIEALRSAVALNRMNDVYYRNLSQANLVKAGQIMQSEPTEVLVNQVNAHVTEAVEMARKAVDINRENVDNYSNLATVYQSIASFTSGSDAFAIQAYEDALELEPNNPVFMNEIGKLYVLRSDAQNEFLSSTDAAIKAKAQEDMKAALENAVTWFNRAITAKPDYAAAHFNLGLVYERDGRIEDSIRKFEEVLRANPQDIGVAFQLAVLYYRNGNVDAARSMFEQIVQQQPNYANAHWLLSTIYEEEGKIDLAIAEVEEVRKSNPDNAQVSSRIEALKAKKAAGRAAPLGTEQIPLPNPLLESISSSPEQNLIGR